MTMLQHLSLSLSTPPLSSGLVTPSPASNLSNRTKRPAQQIAELSIRSSQSSVFGEPTSHHFFDLCILKFGGKYNIAKRSVQITRAAQEVRTEQKVRVVLCPYKEKIIKLEAPKINVSEEEVEKRLKEKLEKTHVIERINFTGSGAKLGHTVKINFEGKYVEGKEAGLTIKGTKAAGYELELRERDDEPWKTIVKQIVKAGMGQEESKSFELTFPTDYKAKALAGIKARFSVTVKEIGVKKELEKDVRSVEAQRAEILEQVREADERRVNDIIDEKIKHYVSENSEADVEKVAASVTWAKFGQKSLADFKWNVIQEEIARVEGIPFDQVPAFLRSQADISYV